MLPKKNHLSAVMFLIVFLSVNVIIQAQAADDNNYLRWNAIDGASFYILEVMKEGKEVLRTETEETSVQLFLVPGDYLYRISVFNKFKRSMAESGWREFTVKDAVQPVIGRFTPGRFYLDNNNTDIKIRFDAYNIADNADISLINSSGTSIDGKISLIGKNDYEAEFFPDFSDIPEAGEYFLHIKNLSGLSYTSPEPLLLIKPKNPEVSFFDKRILSSGLIHEIKARGTGFEDGLTLELRKGRSVIKPVSTVFESENNIMLLLDLSGAPPGDYEIYSENPSGLSSISSQRIRITEEIDYNDLIVNKDLFTIHGGIIYGYALSNLPDYHNYNYMGYTCRLQIDFNNDFFNSFIWLSPFGTEFEFDYYPKDIDFFELGVNIYYKSRFRTPFNFILRGGAGVSIFPDVDNGPDTGPDTGRYIQGTAGITIRLLKFIYFDFSTGPKTWIFEREYYNYLISTATLGYTF